MHNFSLALNPTVSQLRSNLEIIETATNEDMYRVWVSPGMMVDGDATVAATYVDATATIPEHWELTEGAGIVSTQWFMPIHPQWKDGVLWLTAYYATNGTSAGNVRWRTDYLTLKSGDALGGFVNGTAFELAAPTATSTFYALDIIDQTTGSGFVTITAGTKAVALRIARNANHANDTHTDDIQLFGVVVNYKESRRQL